MPIGKTHKRPIKRREVAVKRSANYRAEQIELHSYSPYLEHHYATAMDFLNKGVGKREDVLSALKFLSDYNKRTGRLIKTGESAERSNRILGQPVSEHFVQELKASKVLHQHLTDLLNEYRKLRKR